ncbi:MAG: type IV toxin-antitoxin system AbiEi family antitoxin domain-containing protein [Propionibacteriaceae bacterium]|nr:type IV toxin-antitoxin system AbiEi family antitoxin domain-containing protein [Propionibacteriaceae bacterium]
MKATWALLALADLTAAQWGLATTAQAARLGVGRLELSRLARDGHLERLGHGIYRATAVPADRREALKAAWLSVSPGLTAEERLRRRPYDAVVSGAAASWLLAMGDLVPEPYEFTAFPRRQTQRTELVYRTRALPDANVTIREGLPVTTPEQTIADLVDERYDLSLVADALSDAANIDRDMLSQLLAPLAQRHGSSCGDGEALLRDIERSMRNVRSSR